MPNLKRLISGIFSFIVGLWKSALCFLNSKRNRRPSGEMAVYRSPAAGDAVVSFTEKWDSWDDKRRNQQRSGSQSMRSGSASEEQPNIDYFKEVALESTIEKRYDQAAAANKKRKLPPTRNSSQRRPAESVDFSANAGVTSDVFGAPLELTEWQDEEVGSSGWNDAEIDVRELRKQQKQSDAAIR